jgi:MFS family permease
MATATALFAMWLIMFTHFMTIYIVLPMMPHLLAAWLRDGFHEAEVAGYIGGLVAVFYLSQCLTEPAWRKCSDRFGRRLTLLVSVVGDVLGLMIFAWAIDLDAAFLGRAAGGALSGLSAIGLQYMNEVALDTYEVSSAMTLADVVASFFGPLLGGCLWIIIFVVPSFQTDPWDSHPALLLGVVGGSLSCVSFLGGLCFLTETDSFGLLRSTRDEAILRDYETLEDSDLAKDTEAQEIHSFPEAKVEVTAMPLFHAREDTPLGLFASEGYSSEDGRRLLQSELQVAYRFECCKCLNRLLPAAARRRVVLLASACAGLAEAGTLGYDLLFLVLCEAPRSSGGLGLSPVAAGMAMSARGLLQFLYMGRPHSICRAKLGLIRLIAGLQL